MNTAAITGARRPALTNRKFLLWLGLLTLIAWLLREYFVLVTVVEAPIRGDVRDYVAYAWNLLNHGVFSHTWPGAGTPVSDDFRGPGYPLFLALWMAIDPRPNRWYGLALHSQAVLGALTATFAVLLARHWLSRPWSLVAGVLVAVWPHHIAATGAMLTEVVFGFALVSGMWLASEAMERRSSAWAAASGLAFGYAILTNMVALMFPVVLVICWRNRTPRAAAALLACALIAPAAWSMRSIPETPGNAMPGRITLNVVQGSWPQYHRAYLTRNDPISQDIMSAIGEEEQLLASSHAGGLSRIVNRMADDPGYYSQWYLLEKPFLLWDWGIRMGAGDVYFHALRHSPLETQPALHAIKRSLERLNPAIFALSAASSFVLLLGWVRGRPWAPPAAAMVASFCIYVTCLHAVLQAEPRYAIPYRPMQMLMLTTALSWLAGKAISLVKK